MKAFTLLRQFALHCINNDNNNRPLLKNIICVCADQFGTGLCGVKPGGRHTTAATRIWRFKVQHGGQYQHDVISDLNNEQYFLILFLPKNLINASWHGEVLVVSFFYPM